MSSKECTYRKGELDRTMDGWGKCPSLPDDDQCKSGDKWAELCTTSSTVAGGKKRKAQKPKVATHTRKAKAVKHNGRTYTVRTGPRGGKYIEVTKNGKKQKVWV